MTVYDDYYLHQVGSGLSVFAGARRQRGHGFFNTVMRLAAPLIKKAAPLIKRGAKTVGRHLLDTGLKIMDDVQSGQSIGKATKRRGKETLRAVTAPKKAKKNKKPRKKVTRGRTAVKSTSLPKDFFQ